MAESHGTREAVGHVGSTVSKPREKQIGAPLAFSLLCNPGPRPRITQLSQPGNSFLHRHLSPRWFQTLSNRQQILHNHYTSSQPRSRTAFWRLQFNLRTKNFLITEGPVSISPSKQRNPRLWSVTSHCPTTVGLSKQYMITEMSLLDHIPLFYFTEMPRITTKTISL